MIIGIIGQKGNGKDYVSDLIYQFLYENTTGRLKKISFADPMKEALSAMFGLPAGIFYDTKIKNNYMVNLKTKEIKEINLDLITRDVDLEANEEVWISIRALMQEFGTDIVQNAFGKYVWINTVFNEAKDVDYLLIPDVRMSKEAESIKAQNGILIRVNNPHINSLDSHISESGVNSLTADYEIDNPYKQDEDLDDYLKSQIKNIWQLLKETKKL